MEGWRDRRRGVAQDYVSARMWFNLAAAQGTADALPGRDLLENAMTLRQIWEAKAGALGIKLLAL